MIAKLLSLQPQPNYCLELHYEDGVGGIVDLAHLVGKGVFTAWEDPQVFASVKVGEFNEVRWNDEIELCADAIYLELTQESAGEIKASTKAASDA